MKPKSFSQKNSLFTNRYLDLYSVTADFDDFSCEYFVVKKGTRVGVMLRRQDSFLLVKQYRYFINDYRWELPSGGVEPGESLESAAIRECREETGVVCSRVTPLFDFILSADVADSPAYIYTSTDFVQHDGYDSREIAAIRWFSYEHCMQMVMSREIKDIFIIMGLFSYGQSRHLNTPVHPS